MLGIGIGLILGAVIMTGYNSTVGLDKAKIEQKARELGMIYKDEQKSIFDNKG